MTVEELKRRYEASGLQPADIGKGLIIHEALGIGVLFSAWGICYVCKPSSRFLSVLHRRNIVNVSRVSDRVEKSIWMKSVRKSNFFGKDKVQRLGVAFGEGFVFRKALVPILVPLKIWIALKLVLIFQSDKS